jgi:hypothetical protein
MTADFTQWLLPSGIELQHKSNADRTIEIRGRVQLPNAANEKLLPLKFSPMESKIDNNRPIIHLLRESTNENA